jgi:hypothetical protein
MPPLLVSSNQLRRDLDSCPLGTLGWRSFEKTGLDTLTHLFVPPLRLPIPQIHTYSGGERRDAVFPNRIYDINTNWGLLQKELDARMIPVEFKNYDEMEIGSEEVNQISNYLRPTWGRLAILCTNKKPNGSAHRRRNTIYSTEDKKLILFLTTEDLKEMLDMKDRGEDPADFIIDSIEAFYLQHE